MSASTILIQSICSPEHTSKDFSRRCSDAVEDDVALIHGLAVSTATVELAEVVDGEARDGDCACAVVPGCYGQSTI